MSNHADFKVLRHTRAHTYLIFQSVMHDSHDSGIGMNSGMIPLFTGIRIGNKACEIPWNGNQNQTFGI